MQRTLYYRNFFIHKFGFIKRHIITAKYYAFIDQSFRCWNVLGPIISVLYINALSDVYLLA